MALSRTRRRASAGADYWPGFVDAMATLLLVMTFLLSVFMLAQFFVQQESSGKDTALARLNRQIAQLTSVLALERTKKQSIEESLALLQASLSTTRSKNSQLQGLLDSGVGVAKSSGAQIAALTGKLAGQKKLSNEALARVQLLNQQLAALQRQIAALNNALDAAETQEKDSKTRITDLGKRLNIALARKVQELSRYRSEFFGRLRKVLGSRKNVRIEGDRFVFQSEVLFGAGSADLNSAADEQLDKLADALITLEQEIPGEINWVIRVDGHTDATPIQTAAFPSNWELSTSRAISVVRHLKDRGVSAKRLVAAGFGEFHPIDPGKNPTAYRRNRRIELKLTEK